MLSLDHCRIHNMMKIYLFELYTILDPEIRMCMNFDRKN